MITPINLAVILSKRALEGEKGQFDVEIRAVVNDFFIFVKVVRAFDDEIRAFGEKNCQVDVQNCQVQDEIRAFDVEITGVN